MYTKTKQLIVCENQKMVNFGAKNIRNFQFHFQSLFPQDLIKLDQKTLPNAVNNKNCHKKNFIHSCLKTPFLKNVFFQTISHKHSETNPPSPPISMLCEDVTAFG